MGIIWGILAALIGLTPFVLGDSIGILFLPGVMGLITGALCTIPVSILLKERDHADAQRILAGGVSPLICILAMITPSIGQLILYSMLAVIGVATYALLMLPKQFTGEGLCRCGYDLRGSRDSGRCPECGRGLDEKGMMPLDSAIGQDDAKWLSVPLFRYGILATAVFSVFVLGEEFVHQRAGTFDPKRWHTGATMTRTRLAIIVEEQYFQDGESESSVTSLLGKPTARLVVDEFLIDDSAAIRVTFGEDGKVAEMQRQPHSDDTANELFDAEIWKSGGVVERQRMATSLMAKANSFRGQLAADDIQSILGAPNRRAVELVYDLRAQRDSMSCRAVLQESVVAHYGSLVIKLENDRVVGIKLPVGR